MSLKSAKGAAYASEAHPRHTRRLARTCLYSAELAKLVASMLLEATEFAP